MKNHAAIVLRNNNKILFVQRSATKKSLPNIWAFPSGTMEQGETPEITAERESFEELGIHVGIEKILATAELSELDTKLYFILCYSRDGEPNKIDSNEIQAIKWLTFPEFFKEYSDNQIGHGLVYLRKHPEIWETI